MPTGAKLFAAVGFALVAILATEVFKPLMPDGAQLAKLTLINSLIGGFCGWGIAGRYAGRGYYAASGVALRTVAVMVFYVLLLWSAIEMLKQSVRMRYDGPVDAMGAMMELIAKYFLLMVSGPQVPVVLLAGGILAAFMAEWASERFA